MEKVTTDRDKIISQGVRDIEANIQTLAELLRKQAAGLTMFSSGNGELDERSQDFQQIAAALERISVRLSKANRSNTLIENELATAALDDLGGLR